MNCSKNAESSIYVFNDTKTEWSENTDLVFRDKLFDTTYWISYSIAPSTDNCFGSIIEVYAYQQMQRAKFTGLGSWLAACVQNLLSNVNTITQVQEKMTAATNSNDTVALAFWRGRLTNVVLIFEPIPTDDYQGATTTSLLSGHETKLQQWENEDDEFLPTEPYQRGMLSNVISMTQGYFYASFVN